MKKILVLVLVAFATNASMHATNSVDYKFLYKLNSENTFNGMVRYLRVDEEQIEQLKNLFLNTEEKLKTALKNEDLNAGEKVLKYNLGISRNILTPEQYKMYSNVINETISNSVYKTEMVAENIEK